MVAVSRSGQETVVNSFTGASILIDPSSPWKFCRARPLLQGGRKDSSRPASSRRLVPINSMTSPETEAPQVIVVEHFFKDLQERVGR